MSGRGGLDNARHLLAKKTTSDGYARLQEAGRLDLTVEASVLRPEFAPLFTETELASARSRLAFNQRMADRAPRNQRTRRSPRLVEVAPAGRRI